MHTRRITRARIGHRTLVNALAAAILGSVAVAGQAQGTGSTGSASGDIGRTRTENPGNSVGSPQSRSEADSGPASRRAIPPGPSGGSGALSSEERKLGSPGGNSMASPGPGRGSSIGSGGSGAASGVGSGGGMSNPGMGGGSLGLSGGSGATPPAGRN